MVNTAALSFATYFSVLRPRPYVQADLYKLLLYDEGCFFRRHRDNERLDGVFGRVAPGHRTPHAHGGSHSRGRSHTLTLSAQTRPRSVPPSISR